MSGKSDTGLGAKYFAKVVGKLGLLFVGIWILSLLPKEWGYVIAGFVVVELILHTIGKTTSEAVQNIERSYAIQLQQMEGRIREEIRQASWDARHPDGF